MSERPKRLRVDVRGHTKFEETSDGTWRAEFAVLGAAGRGKTEEEAWQDLLQNLQDAIGSSPENAEKWNTFVQENSVEEEISEEELQEKQRVIDLSHEASAGFEVLDAGTFDKAIASSKPVLVDFWAEWCMPCHILAPTLKEVTDKLADKMSVAKMNMDDNKEFWEKLSIEGIPTTILFADGKERFRLVGAGRSKAEMIEALEPHLN